MTENKPQVFGNGGRNDTNGITIDGVQVTSVTWGSAAVITPNPDTIKEMKVVTNPYDAELGPIQRRTDPDHLAERHE